MRTFKRPMFRKGGNVGNGIMSGITDRVQAQEGFLPGSTAAMKGAMGVTEEGINLARPIPSVRPFTPMEYENINIEEMVGTPKTSAEYIEELRAGAGEYGGMDPLTSFLLTAGPSIAGATGFADAIGRLQPATQQLIKQADAKAKYDRDLRLAGVKLGIGAEERAERKTFDLKKLDLSQENQVKFLNDQRAYQDLKDQDKRDYDEVITDRARAYKKLDDQKKKEYEERLIREGRAFELQLIKKKEQSELEKIERKEKFELDKLEKQQKFQEGLLEKQLQTEQQFTVKDFADTYGGSRNQASNRVKFENENIEAKIINKFGDKNFGGLLGGEFHGSTSKKLEKAKDRDVGKVYFDVMDGKVKRLRKGRDGEYTFEIIEDIATFVDTPAPAGTTQEEKDADISKRFKILSPNQKRIIEDIQKNKPDDFGTGA
jgi:hypothetical protein